MSKTHSQPMFCSVTEAMAHLGVARSTLYRAIESGTVKTVKLGGRRLVDFEALKALRTQAI
ncbi:MAG: helix-turn-helix domain-containing protein [Alphaproteobacteria bacterium]|nr:helix-turn-helix domain-containing protein [Alphaproteobacteria bacterium]MBF0394334.1 helix-turn-helix domain-containing protein [Alphaproteobacteria bacterium]